MIIVVRGDTNDVVAEEGDFLLWLLFSLILGLESIMFAIKIFLPYFQQEELDYPPLAKPLTMVLKVIFELCWVILMENMAKVGDERWWVWPELVLLGLIIDTNLYLLKVQWVTILNCIRVSKDFKIVVVLEQARVEMVKNSVYRWFFSKLDISYQPYDWGIYRSL